jgi:CheY-like chemotaxis protein
MSHELRTPLNSMLILAQLLSQNPGRNLSAKQVEYAEIIHSAGLDLMQLINDILDLSKVEAGKMDIAPEELPLRRLLDYVEATFRPMTSQKSLAFDIITAPGVPTHLVTDDSRLRQILRNLLSNAVKFTEAGRVELRIEPAAGGDLPAPVRRHGAAVAIRVTDTGIGIPPAQLEVIFGAFQQADGTTSRKYGGTGLGLSISREIAYLLGGSITVDSTPGKGSTFSLFLPVARPDFLTQAAVAAAGDEQPALADTSSAQPAAQPASPRQRRLLVFEEQPRGLLSMVAESARADLFASRNDGASAPAVDIVSAVSTEEAAAALAAGPCHCVVLDLGMADAVTVGFLAAMDADPALRPVPILAHNSRRLDNEQEQILQARGADRPLELLSSLDELRERIALHLSVQRPGDVPSLLPAEPAREPAGHRPATGDLALAGRTALVVDDDVRNLYALTGILELHGMTVLHADNGRSGVETLTRHPGIDIVLMDVMMPEMDGYAATAAIRNMPAYADLPIIAVTAKAMPGDQDKSMASGASDYITKPLDADALVARIRQWLEE